MHTGAGALGIRPPPGPQPNAPCRTVSGDVGPGVSRPR
ncbi:Hypothetical protein AA314_00780 [Archangium gephyra]|uniref:Uncharacterized protein n=1 Tax=Archangium gephyra TaxID=48 RepID=A0AAC8Q2K5_9BACT|nr:Hypothetical protein AA314_00780 [Archangium gephyra]